MSEEKKSEVMPKTLQEKIDAVNALLKKHEPQSVSHDSYSGYTGYKPQWIVDAMNKYFEVGNWGFDEVMEPKIIDGKSSKGESTQLIVTKVVAWIEKKEQCMPATGQSRVTKGDVGDAMKGAQTDALKKALSYFSIGNRAYHGLLKKTQ